MLATDKPRFTITLDPKMLSDVLEYKDKNKLSTQSKAIQRLIELGIQEMVSPASAHAHGFPVLSGDELELVEKYRQLTEFNRGRVIQQIDTLLENQNEGEVKSTSFVG